MTTWDWVLAIVNSIAGAVFGLFVYVYTVDKLGIYIASKYIPKLYLIFNRACLKQISKSPEISHDDRTLISQVLEEEHIDRIADAVRYFYINNRIDYVTLQIIEHSICGRRHNLLIRKIGQWCLDVMIDMEENMDDPGPGNVFHLKLLHKLRIAISVPFADCVAKADIKANATFTA